jgi:DNA-binding response OmpR family regulator
MRIALVEPSRTVERIVTGIIGPWGHEVCPFMDAPEALAFLRSDKNIRALISSAELVSTSGMQLVSEARALAGPQRPLYIILMLSSEERSKMIEALDHGADDFIAKPPAPEELRARLRAADRITAMQTELIALATTDSLTGLLTRRAFVEAAERMLQRATAIYSLTARAVASGGSPSTLDPLLPIGIRLDQTGIDRKGFPADKSLADAALQDRLEDAPQQIALAEAVMPVLREG